MKRLRRAWISHAADIAAGEMDTYFVDAPYVAQDNIWILGVQLTNVINPQAEFDSGELECMSSLSTVPTALDAQIAANHSQIQGHSTTVGIGSSENFMSDAMTVRTIWFPEGTGIHLDEDEVVYLTATYKNSMANLHKMSCSALIYFVEEK